MKLTEEQKKDKKAYYHKNRARILAKNRVWELANPDARKRHKLKSIYGITVEEYNTKYQQQNGLCAICAAELPGTGAHLDHCHRTGKIRDFLCGNCNLGLGLFKEDLANMLCAIEYLLKHRKINERNTAKRN